MRRRLTSLVLLVSLAVASLTLVPPGTLAQEPAGDSVTADAMDCFGMGPGAPCGALANIFQADVHSGPAGENPTGTVRLANGVGLGRALFDARASCLNVAGDTAIIGVAGRVTSTTDLFFFSGLFRVVDRGGPDSSLDTFEFAPDLSSTPVAGPQDCAAFQGDGPRGVNQFGDIVVRDAPARPTTPTQCKDGGWRSYGATFKNQGQCVAFVQRGSKP